MADPILKSMHNFLSLNWKAGAPIGVGFSGGADSLALLHLLIESRSLFNLDLHVLHVDSGWRQESYQEAEKLKRYVQQLDIPFYLHRPSRIDRRENAAREERLLFFQEVYEAIKCQGLFLGHQGDDQSETILKRILEGASLFCLGGHGTNLKHKKNEDLEAATRRQEEGTDSLAFSTSSHSP